MLEIIPAQTGDALTHLITLTHEYVTWMLAELQTNYPHFDIREFAAEHNYDDILKKFPGDHIAPHGCLLIALNDGTLCGCIALGRLTATICELRTLYVRPGCRGLNIGKQLTQTALTEARNLRYTHVRLDTLDFMTGALGLYRSLGFYDIPPYRQLSPALQQHICFLELNLLEDGSATGA